MPTRAARFEAIGDRTATQECRSTENHWSPIITRNPIGNVDDAELCWPSSHPRTVAGIAGCGWNRTRCRRQAISSSTVVSRPWSTAYTEIPPVTPSETRSVRRTVASTGRDRTDRASPGRSGSPSRRPSLGSVAGTPAKTVASLHLQQVGARAHGSWPGGPHGRTPRGRAHRPWRRCRSQHRRWRGRCAGAGCAGRASRRAGHVSRRRDAVSGVDAGA